AMTCYMITKSNSTSPEVAVKLRFTFKVKVGLKIMRARGPQVSPRYAATPDSSGYPAQLAAFFQ
ncbi:MAG: hypothetical protein J7M17_01885, partial [Anaerolineae bacterium]|nr:hypothetical protein [Anaerolineae bacterium]